MRNSFAPCGPTCRSLSKRSWSNRTEPNRWPGHNLISFLPAQLLKKFPTPNPRRRRHRRPCRRRRRRRCRKSFSRRSSSASRRKSPRGWCAPPSPASSGSASSPAPPSSVATVSSTELPPMLGFFCRRPPYSYSDSQEDETGPLFLSTTKFDACIPEFQRWRYYGCYALDCRHGRVLLLGRNIDFPNVVTKVAVWEPMTGCWWNLGAPMKVESYGAAVLTGCDHRPCHDGPFRVVFVGLDQDDIVASVWLSTLETGECSELLSDIDLDKWVEACSGFHIEDDPYIEPTCPVLVQDAFYFMLVYKDDNDRPGILNYDLSSNSLSLIDAPDVVDTAGASILMEMEDGTLGFAYVDGLTLYVWSRQLGSDGGASWTECTLINLKELLLILNPENILTLIGSVAGRDIIFVTTDIGICEINLKTLQWKKIWKRENIHSLVPYMSFYMPEEL